MDLSVPKPHDLARLQIDTWRGQCLELFAKGERAIGQALVEVRGSKAGSSVKLRHLAGQRADDLAKYISECALTDKKRAAALRALSQWRANEGHRAFLAHAISAVTLDAKGGWFAVFDMTVYRADDPDAQRWTIAKAEAEQMVAQLEAAWKNLSAELGQVRKMARGG